jgi:hypothetical protein
VKRTVSGWYNRELRCGFNQWKSTWKITTQLDLQHFQSELQVLRMKMEEQEQQIELQAQVELRRQQQEEENHQLRLRLEAENEQLRQQAASKVQTLEAEKGVLSAELQTLYKQIEDQYNTFDMAKRELDDAVSKSKDQFRSTAKQLSEQQLASAQSQAQAVNAESRLNKAHSTIGRLQREVVTARGELMKLEEDQSQRTEHEDTEFLTEAQKQLVAAQQHLSDSILLDGGDDGEDAEAMQLGDQRGMYSHQGSQQGSVYSLSNSIHSRGNSASSSLHSSPMRRAMMPGEDIDTPLLELRHLEMYSSSPYASPRSAHSLSSPVRRSAKEEPYFHHRSSGSNPSSPMRRPSREHAQIEQVQAQIMHAQNQLTTATMVLQGRKGEEGDFNDAISHTASTTSSFAESSLRKLGLHR